MIKDSQKRNKINFTIDMLSIIPFFGMIFSGLLLQFVYHMRRNDPFEAVLGFDRFGWLDIHKIFVLIILPLTVTHMIIHYKWFYGVIRKKLFIKGNKQVKRTFWLLIVFLITAATGLIPWAFGYDVEARHHMLEIHDKIALFLAVLFIYHFAVRHNWLAEYIHKRKTNQKTELPEKKRTTVETQDAI